MFYGQYKISDLVTVRKATIAIEYCEMKKVHLEDLPNLRSFSSGDILKWSSLENVVFNHCPNIKKFGLGMIKESQLKSILITPNDEVQIHPHTKLAYLFELLVSSLSNIIYQNKTYIYNIFLVFDDEFSKKLMEDDKFSLITEYSVCNNEELDKIFYNLQSSHFTNLQILRVNNCNGGMLEKFLCMLLKRSHKLKVINIEECSLTLPRFNFWDADDKIFIQLTELKLIKINIGMWFFDDPEYIDLGNLQILHIIGVPSLTYVFDLYPHKLHQLKELIIEKCEVLLTVFLNHFSKAGPTTNFPSLGKLDLKSLPNLRQIYNGHLEFPSLKSLMLAKCPILKKFTTGFADSNETLTTDGKSFFELNEIVFDSYDNLVCVISSETLQELKNLKKLVVSHYKELKIIFNIHQQISCSTHLLQQLCELTLIDLPKLTCIVNKDISMFYQNLELLQVKQCKSLNMLQVPLKLTNLEIYDCDVLDTIIISNEEEEVEDMRGKLTFHELKDVSLENLPSLFVVFPFISEFPSLETLKVANCCTMISFIEDSKALEESSTTNCFFPSSVSFHYKLFIELLRGNYMFSFLSFDIGN